MKKPLSEVYMRTITKRPVFFYMFLLVGISVFIYLTMTIKIETEEGVMSLLSLIMTKAGKGI